MKTPSSYEAVPGRHRFGKTATGTILLLAIVTIVANVAGVTDPAASPARATLEAARTQGPAPITVDIMPAPNEAPVYEYN